MAFTSKDKMYNYAIMSVAGKSLTYKVYNADGKIIDEYEILK